MTHDTEKLLELAERCEKATGPDRELEFEIWWTRQDKEKIWALSGMNAQREAWSEADLKKQVRRYPAEYGFGARYTASLDAAMTLVPEGWWVTSIYFCHPDFRNESDREWSAVLGGPVGWRSFEQFGEPQWSEPQFEVAAGGACTLALTLCAATLRAKASTLTLESGDGD